MKGDADQAVVLLIGIHREELAFGDAVAAGLADIPIDLLRVPEGITGRRPRPDQVFRAETLHRELYHQIRARVRGRYQLLIDLHCGLDDNGPSADLLSTDRRLLAGVEQQAGFDRRSPIPVRSVLLLGGRAPVDAGSGDDTQWTPPVVASHILIPPEIWDAPDLVYAGIEIYRRNDLDADAVILARRLIRSVCDCFRRGARQIRLRPTA